MENQELKRQILLTKTFEEADRIIRQNSNCQSHTERIDFLSNLFNITVENTGTYDCYKSLVLSILH